MAHLNWCPPFGGLTRTVLPIPEREILIVTDETCADHCQEPEKYAWIVDIRNERNPIPIATIQVEFAGFELKGGRFGCHNVHERRPGSLVDDQLVYITYFNGGLRIIDIQDKYRPREVGYICFLRGEICGNNGQICAHCLPAVGTAYGGKVAAISRRCFLSL
ncbi:MAG TPA: hypothetical protein PLL81_08570 [Bacillota bacterium]|nr:hypothetical protein [Bacillota bacterium]